MAKQCDFEVLVQIQFLKDSKHPKGKAKLYSFTSFRIIRIAVGAVNKLTTS